MIMQKLILIIGVITLLLSACKSLNVYNDIKKMVLDESRSFSELLFFQTEIKGKIGYIEANGLRRNLLYDKKYSNYNLDSLLFAAYKGNYAFNCRELSGCFELSNFVADCYKQLSFKAFLKKFTLHKNNRREFLNHHKLTEPDELTIAYFLYLNGYYTVYDDYDGHYYTKRGGVTTPVKPIKLKTLKFE